MVAFARTFAVCVVAAVSGIHPAAAKSPSPGWDFYFGAMMLQRSQPAAAPIVTTTTPPPPSTPIDAQDFNFGWSTGYEAALRHQMEGGWALDGRYFTNSGSTATAGIPSITTFREAGVGVTILGGGPVNAFYTTGVDSTELNVAAPLTSGISVLGGFRWLNLRDDLRTEITGSSIFVQWQDTNALFGGQAGLKLTLAKPASPFVLDASFKAGLYGNAASNTLTANVVSGASSSAALNSFVGEVNLNATYHLTQNVALRAGYVGLWVNNVALAGAAAAATTQIPGGTSSPVTPGNVFFNGATFGLDLSF
jgi:hypothetical protein